MTGSIQPILEPVEAMLRFGHRDWIVVEVLMP